MKKRPEPLFHSLVIMGGSAAIACGGVASGAGGSGVGEPSAGGSGPGGAGGGPGTGGRPGTGGTMQTGGATASGGAGGVAILPCPPAQFSCDDTTAENMACSYNPIEPGGCLCDGTRPTTPDQCGPSELFACRMIRTYDASAGAYTVAEMFDCKCAAVSPDSAGCKVVFDGQSPHDGYETVTMGPDGGISTLLCGCAWVLLR